MKPTVYALRPFLVALAFSIGNSFAAETVYRPSAPPPGTPPATFAAPREDWLDWMKTVQQKFTQYGDKHADIVFDGDSITNRWVYAKGSWARFEDRAADFGIEGDRTENLLWRLGKGQVDGIDPKVVVLMIGTNNCGRDSVEEIAAGVKSVVLAYKDRCPHAHLILMGIFPRGKTPDDAWRCKVAAANEIIKTLDDKDRVSYVDIGSKLVQPDGLIAPDMMPDFVHPSGKGYAIWADSIQPLIDQYAPSAPKAP